MDETAIRDKYLGLFSIPWDSPSIVEPLEQLRKQAEDAGLDVWVRLIDARLLRAQRRFAEGLSLLETVLGSEPDNPHALFLKGALLGQDPDHRPEAIAAFDALIAALSPEDDRPSRQIVAMALVNKGVALGLMDNLQEALPCFNELIRRFADSPEPPLPEQVASALYNKGVALGQMDKPQDALAAYDDVIRRFGDSPQADLRETIARALLSRGLIHFQMGKRDEAITDLNAVNARADAPRWIQELSLVLQSTLGSDRPAETAQAAADLPVEIDAATRQAFKGALEAGRERKSYFFDLQSRFRPDESFLLVLREWNSFTPAIPDEGEAARGGGYFIRHKGTGIVIDPGFDFLEIFHEAGGRLCDIDHIVITHAHNDHTADLEAILTLLYEFNDKHKNDPDRQKKVKLYLSQGAARKLSGIIQLRGCSYISEVVTLNRGRSDEPQRIPITHEIALTVLPAYHDDVVTADYSVGLGFQFDFPDGHRRVIFTGDTAVLPGKDSPQTPIHATYPEPFREPGSADLVVAHIGSIEPYELEGPLGTLSGPERAYVPPESPKTFYDKHLGLRGTFLVFYALRPKAGLVSEFGEEMKSIWIKAVRAIGQKLRDLPPQPIPVFAGDPIIIYNIAKGTFLCHEDQEFHEPSQLRIVSVHQPGSDARSAPIRPYLFNTEMEDTSDREDRVMAFHQALRERRLPHFAQPPAAS